MSVELSTLGTIIHVNKDGKDIFTYDYLELYNLWHNGFGYESEEDADEETEPCVDCEAHILGNELFIGLLECADQAGILCDMFFRHPDPESILIRLKGQKHLIIGNHDYFWMKKVDLEKYFVTAGDTAEVPVMSRWAVLSHYPMLSYRHDSKYYMIHGHIHNNCHEDFWELLVNRPLVLNAGVDVNNYMPVTLPELIENNEIFKRQHPVRENIRAYDEGSREKVESNQMMSW